jgi:hypothetical protein
MNPESLKGMASLLQQYGRNGDTILAHINPREAMLLNNVTDGGSVNPMTGMPEFSEEGSDMDGPGIGGAETASSPGTGEGFDPDADSGEGPGVDPSDSTGEGGSWGFDDVSMDPAPPPGANPGGAPGDQGSEEGIAGLFNEFTPDNPGILEILTAPIETLVSALTLGLVDIEITGKDVLGVPGTSSSDLSRAAAGISGPQPVGVEIGVPGIGAVGIGKGGVTAYGGPVTNTLADIFSLGLPTSVATNLPPNVAEKMAQEKMAVAKAVADERAVSKAHGIGTGTTTVATPSSLPSTLSSPSPPSFYSEPHPASGVGVSMYGVGTPPVDTSSPTSSPLASDWNDPANIQARADAAAAAISQSNAQNTPSASDIDQEIIDNMYGANSLVGTIHGAPSLAPNEFATAGYANGGSVGEYRDEDEGDGGDAGGGVGGVGQDPGGPAEEGDDDEAGGGMGIAEIGRDPDATAAGEALGNAAIMGYFDPEFEAKAQEAYGVPVDRDITVSYDGGIPSLIGRKLGKIAKDIVRNPIRTGVDTAIGLTPYGKAAQGVTAALTGKSIANIGSDAIGAYSDVDPMSQTIGTAAGDIFGKDVDEFDPLSETSVGSTPFGINPDFLDYFEGLQATPIKSGTNPDASESEFTTPTYAQGGPVNLSALYNNVRARRGPITGGQRSGRGIMSLR